MRPPESCLISGIGDSKSKTYCNFHQKIISKVRAFFNSVFLLCDFMLSVIIQGVMVPQPCALSPAPTMVKVSAER